MPYAHGPSVKKLSKMATLLLSRNYILMLTRTVEHLRRLLAEAYSPLPPGLAALAAAKHPRGAAGGLGVPGPAGLGLGAAGVGVGVPPPPSAVSLGGSGVMGARGLQPSVGHLPPLHLTPAGSLSHATPGLTPVAGGLHPGTPTTLSTEALLRMAPKLPPLGLDLNNPELAQALQIQTPRAPFDLLKSSLAHPAHYLPQFHDSGPAAKVARLSPERYPHDPSARVAARSTPTPTPPGDKDPKGLSPPSRGGRGQEAGSVVRRPIPTLPTPRDVPHGGTTPTARHSRSPPAPHSHTHPTHPALHGSRVPYSCCVSTVYS